MPWKACPYQHCCWYRPVDERALGLLDRHSRGKIQRATLTVKDVNRLDSTGRVIENVGYRQDLDSPKHIAVDVSGGSLFYTEATDETE